MKYKKVELEGLPEYELGTVVQAWNDNPSDKVTGVYCGYNGLGEKREHLISFGEDGYAWYRHIRPVPAWTPEKGELVACWNDGSRNVRLRFYRSGDGCYPDGAQCFSDAVTSWSYIARIPDGKRVFTEGELTPEWFKANSEVMEA